MLLSMIRRPGGNLLDKGDRLAFWVSGLTAFAVYFCSLGPSIGLEDAGELATAADVLGVPHPPGYPLWTLLSWCFCRLFQWVTWRGYPNPGWAVALGSAICGALAVGILAALVSRSLKRVLGEAGGAGEEHGEKGYIRAIAGCAAGLCFAFSAVMWSQAVIVEVYALGALFLSLVLWLGYDWLSRRRSRTLGWLGLVFGLGLTNYQVLLLAAVPLSLALILRHWRLAKSFLAAAIPLGLTLYDLTLGAMASADRWSTPGAPVILRPAEAIETLYPGFLAPWWVYALLGGLLLTLIARVLYAPKQSAKRWVAGVAIGLAVLLGVSGFCYAPHALPSEFHGTLYGFWRAWAVHGLALGGLWWLCRGWQRARRFAWVVSLVQITALCLLQQGLLLGLIHPTTGWFWWPILWNVLVLLLARKLLAGGRWVAATVFATEAGLSLYGYMPLVSDLRNPGINWGYARTWEGFKHALTRGQYEAISPAAIVSLKTLAQLGDYAKDIWRIFSPVGALLGILGLGATAWMARIKDRRTSGQSGKKRARLWLMIVGGLFVMMSVVLVVLANPSGDIQDGFIQKVKFISSHQLFAIWIGYGLAIAGVWLARSLRGGRWLFLGLAAGTVAMPIAANLWDGDLIRRLGAAEQTGHDFGWQFGAYMLGGAPTIMAELSPDEEPLPDPFWPAPMEQDAVFFGGTDPGRFVPTYMTYALGFRPDISVLTQTSLADPTYMNVERDLYGDKLWLPSASDVRGAFASYTEAVQSGRQKNKGTISEINGKVQISGSSAIMEICADLARTIWERNPNRPFYLEESYRIPWMDNYLEPAGLAMKLRRQNETEDLRNLGALAIRDGDFWDWFTRRLLARTDFRRDFAAQKSFSTLRASLAGIYARNGQSDAARVAFEEALALFPISPEAIFRMLQESLLPTGRFSEAKRLMRHYLRTDKENRRAQVAFKRILYLAETDAHFQELTAKLREKQASTADVCALARAAEALARDEVAVAYWEQVVAAPDLTARDARDGTISLQRLQSRTGAMALLRRVPESVWPTMSDAELVACSGLAQTFGELDLAFQLLQTALQRYPNSGRVWLGLSLYYYGIGDEARAYEYVRTAIQKGAAALIETDEAVAEIFLRLARRYGPQKGAVR